MVLREFIRPIFDSRTLRYVLALALAVGGYSAIAMWKEVSSFRDIGDVPSNVHAAFSLILGALLVFRTNTAYARWWEARTLWGGLVNASRNLAIKFKRLTQLSPAELDRVHQLLVAFPVALRNHLRDNVAATDSLLVDFPGTDHPWDHIPSRLVDELYEILQRGRLDRQVDGDVLRVIDRDLASLLDICGGCERIHRTRIARSYRTFARQSVLLFLLTLPWGIVHDFGWWTIPLTIMTAYFMLGLEVVAEHIEEPFGFDEDDLDLDGMCRRIAESVDEIFCNTNRAVELTK